MTSRVPAASPPLSGVALACGAILAGLLSTAADSRGGDTTLVVLHTSDLHGHVSSVDELAGRDLGEGLARIATAVKTARTEGHPTLLLDSGDTIQGAVPQALVFAGEIGDGTDPMIRAMNRLGYAAMAVGNHEFDFGGDRRERSRREARFPWLSANTLGPDGRPAFDAYAIRTVGGVRIGVLGLTTPKVASWETPANVGRLRFTSPLDAARRYVPLLRKRERCDVVIVLTHFGFDRDLETGAPRGASDENGAYELATAIEGIDLLLTGHTHTAIDPRRIGSAWVSQPGRYGNTLTRFDVSGHRDGGGRFTVSGIAGRNLSMKEVAPDPEIAGLAAAEHDAAMAALARPLAKLARPISAAGARTGDTALLDWLHSVAQREGKADLSFASLLPGTLPGWRAGELTRRQVWAFYPYENTLVTVRATGRQVREALEVAARCVSGIAEEEGRIVWKRNPAVFGYDCDTLDGAEYALDPTLPEGRRVVSLERNGIAIRDDDVFKVAINSYRAAGGGGYSVWRACPRVAESSKSLRDLLVEDARRRGTLELQSNGNWRLAPSLPEGRFAR